MAATADGGGYWLVGSDGGVFGFGDARFFGSVAGRATAPAVSVTNAGDGYDVTLADGAVWAFDPTTPGAKVAQLPVAAPYLNALRQRHEAQVAIAVALAQVGKPYISGGAGPDGFDCSGLVLFAYAAAGVALPRTAAEQLAAVPRVALAAIQPGDLLFFYPGITHVGIYLGNGLMVDAPHPGAFVRVEPAQPWFGPVMGVGRPG